MNFLFIIYSRDSKLIYVENEFKKIYSNIYVPLKQDVLTIRAGRFRFPSVKIHQPSYVCVLKTNKDKFVPIKILIKWGTCISF